MPPESVLRNFTELSLQAIENFDDAQQRERAADHLVVLRLRGNLREALLKIVEEVPNSDLGLICRDGLELLTKSRARLIKSRLLQQLHIALQIAPIPITGKWKPGSRRFEF